MREIKFRAWADGKMWYPDKKRDDWWFLGCDGYWSLNHGYELEKILCDSLESDDPVLMQYTGLKDRNGVKMFEGDVVSDGGHRGVIKWNEEFSKFICKSRSANIGLYLQQMEVIGNTFENPNLI